jgi:PadR family transcriptional regulator PadR
MAKKTVDLLKGTLDLLILKTLELEPRHGVSISERIAQITGRTFQVKAGSMFPALHRLEQEGFIKGAWTTTGEGHRAKAYTLTAKGLSQLAQEKKQWSKIAFAIDQVLKAE